MTVVLTERQQSVVAYIRNYQEEFGISPTIREMCAYLGLKSPAGVHKVLKKLIEKKVLISQPGKKRSWCLATGPARRTIPLFGVIAAGEPIEATCDLEDELALDPALFGRDDCFALKVMGNSMIEAHILNGDLAVIGPQKNVNSGQIAAVLVAGLLHEATLKIFYRKKNRIELHSANSDYAPFVFQGEEQGRVEIIGKYLGVIRRM